MSYASIEDLRSRLGAKPTTTGLSPEYVAKMMHAIPATTEKNRSAFILDRVKGKRVLEFGASGPMHDAIVKAAASCLGVDREDGPGVVGFDLDDVREHYLRYDNDDFGQKPTIDVIVCGEVIEHLGNPQYFLQRLASQFAGVPVIITVPNAFTEVGRSHLAKGIEQVNRDHVAWYSYKTLKTLLDRTGFTINEFFYYGGNGPTAQGLIVVAESR